MKKSYILIIVLVLIIIGVFALNGKNSTIEAPTVAENNENNQEPVSPVSNMPVPGVNVEEKIVVEQGVKEFTISGNNFSFSPSTITVNKGDKVKITFENTQGFHDFKIDEYGVATKQVQSPATEVLEFTADKTGSFEYYCSVGSHRAMGMKGTLVVK